jgi:hypothetical protein
MSRMRISDVNDKAESNLSLIDSSAEIINCNAEHLKNFEKRQKLTNWLLVAAVTCSLVLHFVL